MYIKPSTSVSPTSMLPTRSTYPVRGASEPTLATVTLSDAGKAIAASLSQLALATGNEATMVLLTLDDRALLSLASRLAEERGLDPAEVPKLAFDLFTFRLDEQRPRPAPTPAAPGQLQLLPALSPRDEIIARSILGSLAMRDTLVSRAFLTSVLDPDRGSAPRVDLEFLRKVVLASSRSHQDGALDPEANFGHRDARAAVASAVAELASRLVVPDDLPASSLRLGRALLRHRLAPLESPERGSGSPLVALNVEDRKLLGLLFAAAERQGAGLHRVDALAHALASLRRAEAQGASRPAVASDAMSPQSASGEARGPVRSGSSAGMRTVLTPQGGAADVPLHELMASHPDVSELHAGAGAGSAGSGAPLSYPPPGFTDARDLAHPVLTLFQSGAHLAAKSRGSYQSLAPPSAPPPDLHAGVLPLDLAQALGVSLLLGRLREQRPLRRKRVSRKLHALHGEESLSVERADHVQASRLRKRWMSLSSRRRRARSPEADPTH